MKDLLLYIAQNLVEHPEQVSVTEVENGDELTLQLRVAPEATAIAASDSVSPIVEQAPYTP